MSEESLRIARERLYEHIQKGETAEAKTLIESGAVPDVNCTDSSGMTPLDQAAYKGNEELVRWLIARGAHVDSRQHKDGYTALMFAALAGKPAICRLLLDEGAYPAASNNIGKTAAEMAAFVGQHECVSIINNHIGLVTVDNIVHPKGDETGDDRYPEDFVRLLHSLVASHQVHPVAILFTLHSSTVDVMKYRKKMLYVVDRVFEKQLRCKDSNEVMSLKIWVVLCALRELVKFVDNQVARDSNKDPKELILVYVKYLLKMEVTDKVRPRIDNFLRQTIAGFPYKHSLLHQTLLKGMSKSVPGTRPSAFEYLAQALFGHRLVATSRFCSTCGAAPADKRCSTCKWPYCSRECQKFDWPIHKKVCREPDPNAPDESQFGMLSIEDIVGDMGGIIEEPPNDEELSRESTTVSQDDVEIKTEE